ncbi:MAG: insulinase family protein [Myxococcales bacterium]|nr:insulinase family protein [Myxococcales bacterium]
MSASFTLARLAAPLVVLALAACPPARPKAGPIKPVAPPKKVDKAKPKPQDPWAGREGELYKSPPVAKPSPLALPENIMRGKLRSGLHLLGVPDKSLPVISVQLVIRSGSIDDPKEKIGLADFVSSMLRQGVRGMSADAISKKIDAAAVHLGAGSGYEITTISCRGRAKQLAMCLDMVSRLVRSPTFPKKEMKLIRQRLKGSIKSSLDNPGALASLHFHNVLYGDEHPAGQPMTMDTVDAITRKDLVAFHRQHYVPDGAVLAISGDYDAKKLERSVKRYFGRWRGKAPKRRAIQPVSDPPAGIKVLLVDKPDLTQSYFSLGHAGIKLDHPDREAVMTMNYTLGGGGFSSRLMQIVRSKGGKTYGIRSGFSFHSDDGHFEVKSFTRNAEIVATLKLVQQELSALVKDKPPTKAELEAAQGKIAGGYGIGFATGADFAAALARAQIRGLPVSYVTDFGVRIGKLNTSDVASAARKHVRPTRLAVVIVGRGAVVAPLLEKAGLPFKRLPYTAPISAAERAARAAAAKAPITAKQMAAARKVLEAALKAAGGRKRIAAIKMLRQQGSAKMGPMSGSYLAVLAPPDRFKIAFSQGPMQMQLVMHGKRAFAAFGKAGAPASAVQRRPLPPDKLSELRSELWRKPPFVFINALAKGARQRVVKVAGLAKGSVAVEIFPPGLAPTTLVLDGKRRLVALHTRGVRGKRVIVYAKHKRVRGVMLPHSLVVSSAGRPQSIEYSKIELNPKVSADIFK